MNGTTLAIEAAHTVCYVNDDCVDAIYVNVAVVAAVIVTAAVAVAEYVDGVVCVDVVVTVFRLSSLSGKKVRLPFWIFCSQRKSRVVCPLTGFRVTVEKIINLLLENSNPKN